jgi:aminoglycoside N3'-acetyltransferase
MSLRNVVRSVANSSIGSLPVLRKGVQAGRQRERERRAIARHSLSKTLIDKHGKVSPYELTAYLRSIGLHDGTTALFQGSMPGMPTFGGSAVHLLSLLRQITGDSGTLLMPAYSERKAPEREVVDLDSLSTYTGLVNEMFRRSPQVVRSIHPRHSLCGEGRLAASLLEGHQYCEFADGVGSPFDRLRFVPNAKILTLGLPPAYTSFLHWAEDIEPAGYPIRIHAKRSATRLRDKEGNVFTVHDHERRKSSSNKLDLPRIARHLTPEAMSCFDFRGIKVGLYDVNALANELLSLRRKGIIPYSRFGGKL